MPVVTHQSLADEAIDHEEVVHARDDATGLHAIIAIHSTALGPSLGGTRFYPYPDERAALADVLRLSEAMTFKSAAAGLSLGGGKAVIVGDPAVLKSEDLLAAYGRAVDSLGGRYITAEDVGTTVEDLTVVSRSTEWVAGLPKGMGGSGDPSRPTARGLVRAMQAVSAHLWDSTSLHGRRVAIQGIGNVGGSLARLLAGEGCEVTIADVDAEAVRRIADETGARVVQPQDVLATPCDFLAPCALGSVISHHTATDLRCRAIVGSANNQLAPGFDAGRLSAMGILYTPDFLANAGGIINISVEFEPGGYSDDVAAAAVDRIFDAVADAIADAERLDCTPLEAATSRAHARLRAANDSSS